MTISSGGNRIERESSIGTGMTEHESSLSYLVPEEMIKKALTWNGQEFIVWPTGNLSYKTQL